MFKHLKNEEKRIWAGYRERVLNLRFEGKRDTWLYFNRYIAGNCCY